ncbi:uncharacterized protein EV422DRAFT_221457 [Fimicolochytrium jonesii]|uniref:uncharacterized protein n=1 Tax=Fimicolochytrium jonesii TaxID=1396493 RepID=UPI0022FF24FB|nr:uncharacterized protein EV422DRAFT_221457 [Fimicolochytrium jonesii]KAI8817349.1 hypothetical protein EV422DRAFT_221457 [Fimicolochytrium jonesii]
MHSSAQTPQSLREIIGYSQQILKRHKEKQGSRDACLELESTMKIVHDRALQLKNSLNMQREHVLSNEHVAQRQRVRQLKRETQRKEDSIERYSRLMTDWESSLANLSCNMDMSLSRGLPEGHGSSVPPSADEHGEDDEIIKTESRFEAQYEELDDVDDNPYDAGGDDRILAGGMLPSFASSGPMSSQPPAIVNGMGDMLLTANDLLSANLGGTLTTYGGTQADDLLGGSFGTSMAFLPMNLDDLSGHGGPGRFGTSAVSMLGASTTAIAPITPTVVDQSHNFFDLTGGADGLNGLGQLTGAEGTGADTDFLNSSDLVDMSAMDLDLGMVGAGGATNDTDALLRATPRMNMQIPDDSATANAITNMAGLTATLGFSNPGVSSAQDALVPNADFNTSYTSNPMTTDTGDPMGMLDWNMGDVGGGDWASLAFDGSLDDGGGIGGFSGDFGGGGSTSGFDGGGGGTGGMSGLTSMFGTPTLLPASTNVNNPAITTSAGQSVMLTGFPLPQDPPSSSETAATPGNENPSGLDDPANDASLGALLDGGLLTGTSAADFFEEFMNVQ